MRCDLKTHPAGGGARPPRTIAEGIKNFLRGREGDAPLRRLHSKLHRLEARAGSRSGFVDSRGMRVSTELGGYVWNAPYVAEKTKKK
jgi:hypothetical protein